jgi:thiol-disulfide isomerase/thioredoxin
MIDSRTYVNRSKQTAAVINFFFSDCPGCREELPVLQAASTKLPVGVEMLGIVHAERRKTAIPFVKEFGLTYDVALDEQGFVAPNVEVVAFPTTLFVDSSGTVVKRHLGAISAAELQQGINQIAHAS